MTYRSLSFYFFFVLFLSVSNSSVAWSEHPLLVRPVLEKVDVLKKMPDIEVKTIEQFVWETQVPLADFFLSHNQRYSKYLPDDALLPAHLQFITNHDSLNYRARFLEAIRVNPYVKIPLYLHLVPGQQMPELATIHPSEITTLRNIHTMSQMTFVRLSAGMMISPLEVLVTANEEPDFGFDLGLFMDNETTYGKNYSFGNQPYGNPNLEYSSQAPFHMGFYHEAGIIYLAGPFLKRTFLEYRVHLYRDLSILAFQNGQDYWGWRFLGWSMHYAGDATMPYHTKPLPGYSTLKMIWINLKALLGFKQARNDAVQLVSNKHTAIESYQHQAFREAYVKKDFNHAFFKALEEDATLIPFDDNFIREVATRKSAEMSKSFDQTIRKYMPYNMVMDAGIEVSDLDELNNVPGNVLKYSGDEGVQALNAAIAERFKSYSMTIKSLLMSVYEEVYL